MFPSIIVLFICVLFERIISTPISFAHAPKTIVIEVRGDCATLGKDIAHQHGYRVVREVFHGFCEIEEDPSSTNHFRHRRAIEQGLDPVQMLLRHEHVEWAESQVAKKRQKREFVYNDPQWNSMWYLMRNLRTPSLPDLNVTGAWTMGYTGRGQVVTFLDDGLEFDHPDLKENYDKDASTDINGNDDDPTPRYEITNENKHGTRCAGEVAAKMNNSICGVGVAYHAKVGGIRMLDGDVTDSVEARSLSHRPDHVDIYSASWGPDDNGLVVDGPGRLAKKAFENGALNGRGGKGSIFVWASGNGGRQFDSCACDGYITSIYTIAISATTEHGEKPWYLEECSGTLASAYSSGQMNTGERDIFTTDLHHECTDRHTGTSAAAPLAAAIYALVLEANPNLTWRDVMHITVLGARPDAIPSNTNIVKNGAGFKVSSRFGFGLMDAGLMTWHASGWKNVPPMSTCESSTINSNIRIDSHSKQVSSINLNNCKNDLDPSREVNYIEQVQIFVTLSTDKRGEIELYLYSPAGTGSQILPKRERDQSNKGFQDWPFLTVQMWGEVPHGVWKLEVVNTGLGSARLISWHLVVHGTREYPLSPRSISIQTSSKDDLRSSCHIECKPDEPCGSSDTNCTACRHYKQPLTDGKFRCVGLCPDGTYLSGKDNLCLPCHVKCASCRNDSEVSCISCKTGAFLVPNTMTCVESCPEFYHTDRRLHKCIRCQTDCASCDTSPHVCSSCPEGYAMKDTDCVKAAQACDANEYFDFTETSCRWCDSRCATCSGSRADQCTSCDLNSKFPHLQYHACVKSCSPGFFLSNSSSCLPCYDTCLNCTSSSETACTACKLGYALLAGEHRCEKHTGKPYYIDSKTGESHTCHASCAQCKGPNPNDCLACDPIVQVLLDDGHCVNDCPKGSYMGEQRTLDMPMNVCLPCSLGCTSCTDINTCQECDTSKGYLFKDQQCYPTCQPGYYLSATRCVPCESPCLACSNPTICFSCAKPLVLHSDHCVDQCPNGYYSNGEKCLTCDPICDTCTGPSENDCSTCTQGFLFDDKQKKCLSQCANGNYYDKTDNICKLCTGNCLDCLHPGSYCRTCAYPMALDIITHRCLSCCLTNQTNNDCCPCASSWDGFCLHPLVTLSTSTPISPFYFSQLKRSTQTIIMILLISVIILFALCLIALVIRQMIVFRYRSISLQEHDNVEYVPLENVDDDDDNNRQTQSPTSVLIANGRH